MAAMVVAVLAVTVVAALSLVAEAAALVRVASDEHMFNNKTGLDVA